MMTQQDDIISKATRRNWEKLNNKSANRLTHRANKSRSQKVITPEGYVSAGSLSRFVEEMKEARVPINDLIFTLCAFFVETNRVSDANRTRFFEEYASFHRLDLTVPRQILKNRQDDWIGFVYQALTAEGHRITTGLYYTSPLIVNEMLFGINLLNDERFLDPCCGSGIFLLKVNPARMEQLYGIDNDPLAVMIAKANLMVKYHDSTVYPQIFQFDFLTHAASALGDMKFNYIVTNPPWGTEKGQRHVSDVISTHEKASLFFTEAFKYLNKNGKQHFLLPSSMLKIRIHSDFRRFVTHETRMESIRCYHVRFKGVFTDFFSLQVSKKPVFEKQNYTFCTARNEITRRELIPSDDALCAISTCSDREEAILAKAERLRNDDLAHSQWALGIITGNNAKILKDKPSKDMEPIFTGKDISKYGLNMASRYLKYDRARFQQCAKDELYRAKEKLVYKFISNRLCFTYDDQQRLFLNSANILIPEVDGMGTKTVLAFLNSSLFNFIYFKRFDDLKILKGNLMALPFPKIASEDDAVLTALVERSLRGDMEAQAEIDRYVFALYQYDSEDIELITRF